MASRPALADATNASALPAARGKAQLTSAKKYSSGGTATGAYEPFAGAHEGEPPLGRTRGAAAAACVAAHSSTPEPQRLSAEASSEYGTPSALSTAGSPRATPQPSSTTTDGSDGLTPSHSLGWHVAPGARGAARPPPDARLLHAKVLALESKCTSLARENERLHEARRAAPTLAARQGAAIAVASPWLSVSASHAPPQSAPWPTPAARRNASVQAELGGAGAQARAAEAARASEAARRHPVFGTLLADLGFKKVFLSSARSLIDHVPIWCRQRPVERARVAEIVAAKTRDGLAFPGVISIFEIVHRAPGAGGGGRSARPSALERPQNVGIFDGQHRLCAIAEMLHAREQLTERGAASGGSNGGGEGAVDGGGDCGGSVGDECTAAKAEPTLAEGARLTRAAAAGMAVTLGGAPRGCAPHGCAGDEALAEAGAPSSDQNESACDVEVLAEVFPVQTEEEVKQWFLELNKAEIVKVRAPRCVASSSVECATPCAGRRAQARNRAVGAAGPI